MFHSARFDLMKLILRPSLAAALAALLPAQMAAEGSTEAVLSPSPAASPWEFRLEPYGWLTGLDGTLGVAGLTTEMTAGFDEIFDVLDMAAALQFEARNGRFGIIADGFYADLGDSGSPPGPLYDSVGVDFKQFIGELSLAYRVYESPRGFVDLYSGFRYNGLSLDMSANVSSAGVQNVSQQAGASVVSGLSRRAAEIAQPRLAEFQTATEAARTVIEGEVSAAIQAEADGRVARDLARELAKVRRLVPNDLVRLDLERTARAVAGQRLALARASAQLEVARLRASVDASKAGLVAAARARVTAAGQKLSSAVGNNLTQQLPASASQDKNWIDPILGVRSQWNINERFFLAAKGDIGGFGVSSDFVWQAQATLGYNFTENVFAELGYRYLQTDYTDRGFTYDVAQSGLFIGMSMKF
jgi:hypothetical protein